jgi:hypothetical protein
MIKINEFLKNKENELIIIINSINGNPFSSHDFIEKFSKGSNLTTLKCL